MPICSLHGGWDGVNCPTPRVKGCYYYAIPNEEPLDVRPILEKETMIPVTYGGEMNFLDKKPITDNLRQCDHCGTMYHPVRSTSKYHNDTCRKQANRASHE